MNTINFKYGICDIFKEKKDNPSMACDKKFKIRVDFSSG
jgi:hypothetical protein